MDSSRTAEEPPYPWRNGPDNRTITAPSTWRSVDPRAQHLGCHCRVIRWNGYRVVRLLHLWQFGGGALRGVLSGGESYGLAAQVARNVRGRLRGASVWRTGLRPNRRPRGSKIRIHDDAAHHGRFHRGD